LFNNEVWRQWLLEFIENIKNKCYDIPTKLIIIYFLKNKWSNQIITNTFNIKLWNITSNSFYKLI